MPKRLLRMDPRSGFILWALWATTAGAMLCGPGSVLDTARSFRILSMLPVPSRVWGALMLCDAAAILFATFHETPRLPGLIACVSAAFWIFIGATLLISSFMTGGYFSSLGAFSIVGGLYLLITAAQWGARLP